MKPRSWMWMSPLMWASATSWLKTESSAYSFLMVSASVRLVASGPWGTLAFSLLGWTISCSTSYRGIPSRVCCRLIASSPLSTSLALTSSRIRGADTAVIPDWLMTSSTSPATWAAVAGSIQVSLSRASMIFCLFHPSRV